MLEKCPKCGGHLTDEPGNEYLVCDDCGEIYNPEIEKPTVSVDPSSVIEDQTEETVKFNKIKKAIIAAFLIITAVLAAGLVYGIVSYNKSADAKDDTKLYSDFEEPVKNAEKKPLTEEVLRADYEKYYNLRYLDGKSVLIIAGCAIGIGVAWIMAMIVIEIFSARIFRRKTNNNNIRLVGVPAMLAVIAGICVFAIYRNSFPPSPDKASFRVYAVEDYMGTTMESVKRGVRPHTRLRYYMLSEDSSGIAKKSISRFDYHHVYPKQKGDYYVASVNGKDFKFYPMSNYNK